MTQAEEAGSFFSKIWLEELFIVECIGIPANFITLSVKLLGSYALILACLCWHDFPLGYLWFV